MGSIKHLAASGTYSVTYYETTGWRGVMEAEDGPSLPKKFHSIAGAVFPLYHVLADVGEFAGGHSVSTTSSAPLNVEAMALKKGDRVVTQGGIYGTVQGVEPEVVYLKIAENVKVKVSRSAITSVVSGETGE